MQRSTKSILAAVAVALLSLSGCSTLKGPQGATGNVPSMTQSDPSAPYGFESSPP